MQYLEKKIYKWAKGLKTNRLQSKQNWKSLVKKLMKYVNLLDFMFIFFMIIPQA